MYVIVRISKGLGIPCVQRVIRWTLCAADEADNSGRVVAPHAVFHIEGHILLSITGYHSIMPEHVAGC